MPLKLETGETVDISLMLYDAHTWTREGRQTAADWLRRKADIIEKEGHTFSDVVRMRRLSHPRNEMEDDGA